MRTWLILAASVVAGAPAPRGVEGLPAYGHHSFALSYLEDQTVSISGELVEFDYRNPHAWVHVSAVDNAGKKQKVGAEWASASRLKIQGITPETLKIGDRLVLTGSPSRDPQDYRMHLKRLERPADGWNWVGRNQPR
jgi:uncharacterized protein DUF6152